MAACKFNLVVRSFSSSAVQNQLVKTPVPVFGVAGRYVSALYSAATKAKEIDKIEGDFLKFQDAIKRDKGFSQILRDPTHKKVIKTQIIETAASQLGLSKSSTNCLKVMAENGRLKDFDVILNTLKIVMAAHKGEVLCEVTSAKPLSDAEKKDVETALMKFSKKSSNIKITFKVDPSIMGGLIVTIGDKYVDMSIQTKLKKYTKVLEDFM